MPDYLLIIRDEGTAPPMEPAQELVLFDRFVAWAEQLRKDRHLKAVDRLTGDGGKTVRRRGGRLVVDGPFAEGKEAVMGYFLVEARDDAEAASLAMGCPGLDAAVCAVEVRQVGDFPKPPAS
jgi:hypothetical protein